MTRLRHRHARVREGGEPTEGGGGEEEREGGGLHKHRSSPAVQLLEPNQSLPEPGLSLPALHTLRVYVSMLTVLSLGNNISDYSNVVFDINVFQILHVLLMHVNTIM